MTIEVGKWYMTRSGHKAFVAASTGGDFPLYGHVEFAERQWIEIWTAAGRSNVDGSESFADLVALWPNKPIIDWSKEREWVKAVAMDDGGSWYRYDAEPIAHKESGVWRLNTEIQRLHPTEHPTNPDGTPWTGDWKESLIVRPEGGAK